MPENSTLRRTVQTPYGFLSYGRTPQVPDTHRPPDSGLIRLHDKLSEDVMALTDLQMGRTAVYLDRRTMLGSQWKDELKRHLAECQVLIPVLSPRLFASRWCAVEWQCFELRQQLQRDKGAFTRNAIVPVLWIPMDHKEIPSPYADVQYTHEGMGHSYEGSGLYGLLSNGRHTTFNRVIYQLARHIVEVAVSARLEPCDPALFDDLFDSLDSSAGQEH
ncbi:TIR-like protein FxsC [Streptomyces polygonati]|uniref:TIR-like protein FxsC n=1 Tax=Streptomyces polygonati TaxID=1617087 RepID=A0ABV8HUF3_9ACTN